MLRIFAVDNSWDICWIDRPEELKKISKELLNEDLLSVDTETFGWQTGNEELCLVQIGIPSRELVALIDPLTTKDLTLLSGVIENETPELVAHNASFEARQFRRYGLKMNGIIDTLKLARELRPDLPDHTLKTCCKALLGVEISKTEQTSNWSKRPLSDQQIKYAALDAEIAIKLYWELEDLQEKIDVDESLSVPELMRELRETVKARYQLTRSISEELAVLNGREDLIRAVIREKLIDGEPAYDGEYGKCKVTKARQTEIDPEKVRRELPEIAELVIDEYVDKKHLAEVAKEYGIDKKELDKVTDIIGYQHRMRISLKDVI
ncbi:MAG: hypothetical protein D6719_03780 [Candidatus Dadabacteria bacterium]|nr:MAG: hypothetical protein D6719_03780 [Candidatus Dadabacteria bacterium]